MVLSKDLNPGGGVRPATPPQRNRRRAASEVLCEQPEAPTEIRTGYHEFLSAIKESNESCVFLPVTPLKKDSAIVDPEEILTKMLAPMIHFTTT